MKAQASLGTRNREALMLVAWDGLEHRDAARVMGCGTGAFTVRVHRARRRLARTLRDEEQQHASEGDGQGHMLERSGGHPPEDVEQRLIEVSRAASYTP